jgi:3-methyladenine DNA glycosylase AlkD
MNNEAPQTCGAFVFGIVGILAEMIANEVIAALKQFGDPGKAEFSKRFFKTGKGEYGYGDKFLGMSVPEIRSVVKQFRDLSLSEIEKLLASKYHEVRLTALLILVDQFKKSRSEEEKKRLFDFYLSHTAFINNWDMVDCSAEHIIGGYLIDKDKSILYKLAKSQDVWERRISIISTFHFIKKGECNDTLRIAEILLQDKHDLIHKAVGWMLREVGKRCSREKLVTFLNTHTLPRTMLRYAIEHFPKEERQIFMAKK